MITEPTKTDNDMSEDLHANPNTGEIRDLIKSFVSNYSIEIIPTEARAEALISSPILPGTDVYVAHPPNASLSQVVDAAIDVQKSGCQAVPHLVARKLTSVEQLETALKRLQDSDINKILVIGGDKADPDRIFDSSLDVFYTGMLERHGFEHIGFAGHPEGSRHIGASILKQALADKLAYAAQSPSQFYILTQFGFDSEPIVAFEKSIRADGHSLPIDVGLAGKTDTQKLLKFAVRCGVRSSLGLLFSRSDILKGLTVASPENLLRDIARYSRTQPDSLFRRGHFFTFGDVELTANWLSTFHGPKFEQ